MWNHILRLIGPARKGKLFALSVMMSFGAFLEMLGIAMIMGICSFLIAGMDLPGSQILCRLFEHIGLGSRQMVMGGFLAVLIVLYLFKMAYLLIENRILARFICGVQHEISSKLFEEVLHRPYSWFAGASTAEVISLLSTDTNRAGTYLDAFLELVAETLVLIILGTALMVISPAMTLCVLLGTGLSLFVTRSMIKPSAYRAGKIRQEAGTQRLKWLKQGVQGIKDVKIWQAERYFAARYEEEDGIVADCDSRQRALTRVPGFCIEGIMAVSVLAYVFFQILMGKDLADSLPSLSALAASVVRLLPAVRRISGNLIRIANTKASAETVAAALERIQKEAPEKRYLGDVLEHGCDAGGLCADLSGGITVSHVTFSYENRPEPILTDVSLEIPAGSSVGVTGPSGIGKTTLADLLLGLLEPCGGSVRVGGTDIRQCLIDYQRQAAYIPQSIFLLDDTVRSNVIFCTSPDSGGDDAVWAALQGASLADFVKRLPDGLDTLIGENGIRLSGGERQRLGIARALYRGSQFIVFDEATSALDPETEAAVIRSIQELHGKKTMVIISHRASAVAGCDQICRIRDGKVYMERKDGSYSSLGDMEGTERPRR